MVCFRSLFTSSVLAVVLLARMHGADLTATAMVSGPPVQPGGTAQITVTLSSPLAVAHGRLQVDLDPAVFGDISAFQHFQCRRGSTGCGEVAPSSTIRTIR